MTLRQALEIRFGRKKVMRSAAEMMVALMVETYNHDMLEASRHNRDMIAQFLVELDRPEDHDELRATLHAALMDLSDHVARLEEHVG